MRVLSHGVPFFCDETPLRLYRGPHEIRYVGNYEKADYQYDPRTETASDVIERIGQDWQPDLMLCWMPSVHPPPMGIEDAPVRTAALVSDWNVFHRPLSVNLARYDVALCDRAGVDALATDLVTPHYLMPLYSQISTIHKPYPVERDLDIVFIGNLDHTAHLGRARFLERLAKLSDRYRVVITAGVYGEDYGRLLSRARIVFNHSIRGELNLRVFETIACGALPVLEEDNLEVRDWFDPDVDIVLYNETNFEERIAHFLDNPQEAGAIAARAHARASAFAGENRFTQLIDGVADLPDSSRRFRELPEKTRDFETFLMYGYSRWDVYHGMEADILERVVAAGPKDARVWTAAGKHLLNPCSEAGTPEQRRERYTAAFVRACDLDPESAPNALSMAAVCRMDGNEGGEAHFLQRAIEAESLAGADSLVGDQASAFIIRWRGACARGAPSLDMLRAEAHIRLAVILARNGHLDAAESCLLDADVLDPDNTSGVLLYAEILWATERHDQAIQALADRLPRLPMAFDARERLIQMLEQRNRNDEAQALFEETLRIRNACVEMEGQ
ncbi:MAG: glycosyltransferase [bacterium]|nr:glycosyltransferase [bacterium]